MIKMRFEFLRNYERNLVKSAINERDAEIADKMLAKGYNPVEIFEITGVDISKR